MEAGSGSRLGGGRGEGPGCTIRGRGAGTGGLFGDVWVGGNDGRELMVKAELVRLGYARIMTVPPNVRHVEILRKL